jgi:hypothetical protein
VTETRLAMSIVRIILTTSPRLHCKRRAGAVTEMSKVMKYTVLGVNLTTAAFEMHAARAKISEIISKMETRRHGV